LARLAADKPLPTDIIVPETSYAKLKLNHLKKDVKHQPIVTQFLKRTIGAHSNALQQFVVKETDLSVIKARKSKKARQIEAVMKRIVTEQLPEDDPAYKELEDLTSNTEQLANERKASKILGVFTELLREQNSYEKPLYHVETYGEIMLTVDRYKHSIATRVCDPINTYFIPGEDVNNISQATRVLEDMSVSIFSIFDRFDLTTEASNALYKLIKDSSPKGTDNGSSHVFHSVNNVPITGGESLVTLFTIVEGQSSGIQNFDPVSMRVLLQKFTNKSLRKRKKVFSSVIDISEDNYRIESEFYEPLPNEKASTIYDTIWTVYYYLPCIDTIIQETEVFNQRRKAARADNYNNGYAGFIQTITGEFAHSWLESIEPLIHIRNGAFASIAQLISDNLGSVMQLEFKAIASDLNYDEFIASILHNKIATLDSTQLADSKTLQEFIGRTFQNPLTKVDLDNSGNVARLFDIVKRIEETILTGKGESAEAMGNIGQHASVSNVEYAAQQGANTQAPSIKLYYLAFAQLYQIIINTLQAMNKESDLNSAEVAQNSMNTDIIEVSKGELDGDLVVSISTSLDELALLHDSKRQAGEALHQKVIDMNAYFEIRRSTSSAEIAKILETAQKKASEAAAANQQAALKAQKEAKDEERAHDLAKLDKELANKLEVENIQKEAKIESARIAAGATIINKTKPKDV